LPQYELSGPSLSRNERHQLISSLNNVMLENVGSPIIYTLVTMVKNFLEVYNEDKNDSHLNIVVPTIQHGDVLTDRKSRFQAHVARVHSEDEVKLVLERLLENPKIVRATHNIYAYRIIQSKDGRITRLQNCFDDGETGASSKVLQLLEKMKAENVLVVVSRWYGGIHLGPDRFRHITNLTYDILSKLEA
uniref:RWD domain-containing protein n=1 Tax=Angiostrongylus cantonensis TaxID=6313 RepID=A0A0K0DG42_ANGCA